MQRYFKVEPAVYEQVRQQLDAEWGHGPQTGTDTCVTPAETAPKDSDGMVVLAVKQEFCDYPAVSSVLSGLLASGAAEEISREDYMAAMPVSPA